MIVCADADIAKAAEAIVLDVLPAQRQICCAVKRVFVEDAVYSRWPRS